MPTLVWILPAVKRHGWTLRRRVHLQGAGPAGGGSGEGAVSPGAGGGGGRPRGRQHRGGVRALPPRRLLRGLHHLCRRHGQGTCQENSAKYMTSTSVVAVPCAWPSPGPCTSVLHVAPPYSSCAWQQNGHALQAALGRQNFQTPGADLHACSRSRKRSQSAPQQGMEACFGIEDCRQTSLSESAPCAGVSRGAAEREGGRHSPRPQAAAAAVQLHARPSQSPARAHRGEALRLGGGPPPSRPPCCNERV